MLLVRPGRLSDLDQLEVMARAARPLLHSLPPDRAALEKRLALSQDSFRADVTTPGEEFYLFVLEDTDTGHLHGTASIVASAGYSEPFYAFRNDALIHASRELKVNRKVHALTISHQLTGKSRLTGYYIDPQLNGTTATRLLSRARLLFVAQHRERFAPEIFTVLLGMTDEQGDSPFWEAVGRKFFQRDFADVEIASGGRSATFIAEVMPNYPLYVPLLPPAAQRVLGEPHPNAELPYSIHVEEGFEPDGFVDIFDAGPVLTAAVDMCESVRHSQRHTVAAGEAADGGLRWLVANTLCDDFRCAVVELPAELDEPIRLPDGITQHLELAAGDECCCVPLQLSGARR
ncbi:arginine/ornithine succinyltransferase subunit alpha [Silvimonas iriomotensis]|uniref:Arginine N-succinyltransferase subunit alpha n=1 Tax=Silvimonas iriomotensis TaxID=449662 RepID=A0ABQ2P437_9NEIS|nr:arginine/ornithine succinyltransferase subunit alpha [Silvimonas iriomotensis]GGP17585.1 arginine N-succinyltransferase subunit alpha [Silvimonas iriomotensis]